ICHHCSQPLLDDDGLCAMDKFFHTNCFVCKTCEVPFRDMPFFENAGEAYCRSDYLALFGKTVCAGCMEMLEAGQRAIAVGSRIYHVEHFCCEGCGDLFDEDTQYYERDNAPYCSRCNIMLFGTCHGCNEPITADRAAVSALGRNWHLMCVTCAHCSCTFPDGLFFSHEDAGGTLRAYCERDYMDLFAPRCRGCNDPVADRGMFACSASWHTPCFVCTVCKEPFPDDTYFDVAGRPYCTKDYYEQFGSKCSSCHEYITDEVVNALGKTYHQGHFACHKCNKPFTDMEFYEKNGEAYDPQCYAELFCSRCPVCHDYIVDEGAMALGVLYHPKCLTCTHCGDPLETTVRRAPDGKLYCEQDYLALVANACARCGGVIEDESINALDKTWHPWCFTCAADGCSVNLADGDGSFHEHGGQPYCQEHFTELAGKPCAACGKGVLPHEQIMFADTQWHAACFKCIECKRVLSTDEQLGLKDAKPVCADCLMATLAKCAACEKPITSKFLTVLGRKYHSDGCLSCVACRKPFGAGDKMYQRDGWPVCMEHARGPLSRHLEAQAGVVLLVQRRHHC
ncbi:hypothetical protein EON62_03380, partial [archaeon]